MGFLSDRCHQGGEYPWNEGCEERVDYLKPDPTKKGRKEGTMKLLRSRTLRLAATSSDAQVGLMRDFGFGTVAHVEHRAQSAPRSLQPLSRVKDKLRKEYDEIIPFTVSKELGELLSQLDRAA
jgi:hypothetical protein